MTRDPAVAFSEGALKGGPVVGPPQPFSESVGSVGVRLLWSRWAERGSPLVWPSVRQRRGRRTVRTAEIRELLVCDSFEGVRKGAQRAFPLSESDSSDFPTDEAPDKRLRHIAQARVDRKVPHAHTPRSNESWSSSAVAFPAIRDAKAASDRVGVMTSCDDPANCVSESRPFMASATNGSRSAHTTSAEGRDRAAFAASPTRPQANAAHADRTLNPASARPMSPGSSRRFGPSNTAAKRVPPRSPNRQRAIRS